MLEVFGGGGQSVDQDLAFAGQLCCRAQATMSNCVCGGSLMPRRDLAESKAIL